MPRALGVIAAADALVAAFKHDTYIGRISAISDALKAYALARGAREWASTPKEKS